MYKLGIDIGSTTIKMALIKVESQKSKDRPLDSKPVVLATDYRRHNAEPMKVGQEMMEGILQRSGLTASEANGLTVRRTVSLSASPALWEWVVHNGLVSVFTKR